MPREQINTPARRTVSTPTGSNGLKPGEYGIHFAQDGEALHDGQHREDTPVLMVGWHKESSHGPTPDEPGCVQFHLLVAADEVLRAADEIRRCRENPDVPGYPQWTFSTVMLSRAETQKAIRVVRRARDAAFGGDE
ncbi:MAG: hypothetical protein CMH35_01640 [Microbacterium sp.]|nr:hypothetical protein [Planctomycetota bacterium]MAM53548.1 hypothetical protein [Microbacterium sp.]